MRGTALERLAQAGAPCSSLSPAMPSRREIRGPTRARRGLLTPPMKYGQSGEWEALMWLEAALLSLGSSLSFSWLLEC